jgi:F-type H+-transporting ATPase subunit b
MTFLSTIPQALLAAAASSAESEGGSNPLIQIHPGTIIWTLIIFVVVALVLGKFLWKPILKMVDEREKRIREALEKADLAKADAVRALGEQKKQLDEQRKASLEFLGKAKEDAKLAAEEVLEKSRRDANEQVERARRQIEEEKNRAIAEIRAHAVELALQAASHLLGKRIDSATDKAIVQEYVNQLPDNLRRH